MILSLGLGEQSYVPDALAGLLRDAVELDMVAFCQCYATDLASWQLILFFANSPDWAGPEALAAVTGLPMPTVMQQMGRLAEQKLLEERILITGPLYRLTPRPAMRRAVLRLREIQRGPAAAETL